MQRHDSVKTVCCWFLCILIDLSLLFNMTAAPSAVASTKTGSPLAVTWIRYDNTLLYLFQNEIVLIAKIFVTTLVVQHDRNQFVYISRLCEPENCLYLYIVSVNESSSAMYFIILPWYPFLCVSGYKPLKIYCSCKLFVISYRVLLGDYINILTLKRTLSVELEPKTTL